MASCARTHVSVHVVWVLYWNGEWKQPNKRPNQTKTQSVHKKKGAKRFLDSLSPLVYTYAVGILLWMENSAAPINFSLLVSVHCFYSPRDVWIHILSSKISALLCYVTNLISSSAICIQDLEKMLSRTKPLETFLQAKLIRQGVDQHFSKACGPKYVQLEKNVILSGGTVDRLNRRG